MSREPAKEIYVVAWSYSDGSGFGVVRAFAELSDAEDLMALMNECHVAATLSIVKTKLVPSYG